ncbi:hypothetical protein CL622_00280 [archaeon]|nr:hypothetical protein [archaeon]|tara:strand:+ start:393 stop:734 length:342 start_codon:yes stop_codon:yes gene_type:complete
MSKEQLTKINGQYRTNKKTMVACVGYTVDITSWTNNHASNGQQIIHEKLSTKPRQNKPTLDLTVGEGFSPKDFDVFQIMISRHGEVYRGKDLCIDQMLDQFHKGEYTLRISYD